MIYTGSGRSPTSSLRDDRVRVPRLNVQKFLQWGARIVEEVGELELGKGYPKESFESKEIMEISLKGCPGCPYIESGARFHTKKEVLPTEGP